MYGCTVPTAKLKKNKKSGKNSKNCSSNSSSCTSCSNSRCNAETTGSHTTKAVIAATVGSAKNISNSCRIVTTTAEIQQQL